MVDVESGAESESDDEINSIDLLMESYVNLEKNVEIIAKAVLKQTELLQEIREKLEEF